MVASIAPSSVNEHVSEHVNETMNTLGLLPLRVAASAQAFDLPLIALPASGLPGVGGSSGEAKVVASSALLSSWRIFWQWERRIEGQWDRCGVRLCLNPTF